MPDHNVNLIFHGMFLFAQRNDFMEVLIPNMDTDHVYRAGMFLVEETLQPLPLNDPYLLNGVTGGGASFDKNNIVFAGQDYDHTAGPSAVYARIVLPRPADIISLRPTQDPFQAYVDSSGAVNGNRTCGLQILRYDAADLRRVQFPPHPAPLGPHTITASGDQFLNIHLFAENDGNPGPTHSLDGFEKTLQLLPGLSGKIYITNTTILLPADDPANELAAAQFPAKGFSLLETMDLLERRAALTSAGEDWRNNTPSLPPLSGAAGEPPQDCYPLLIGP